MKPPIKEGPQGGKYQPYGRGKQRRILPSRKIQTGPKGGKFQTWQKDKHKKKRYLLHEK